jgi:hypothetical protein
LPPATTTANPHRHRQQPTQPPPNNSPSASHHGPAARPSFRQRPGRRANIGQWLVVGILCAGCWRPLARLAGGPVEPPVSLIICSFSYQGRPLRCQTTPDRQLSLPKPDEGRAGSSGRSKVNVIGADARNPCDKTTPRIWMVVIYTFLRDAIRRFVPMRATSLRGEYRHYQINRGACENSRDNVNDTLDTQVAKPAMRATTSTILLPKSLITALFSLATRRRKYRKSHLPHPSRKKVLHRYPNRTIGASDSMMHRRLIPPDSFRGLSREPKSRTRGRSNCLRSSGDSNLLRQKALTEHHSC